MENSLPFTMAHSTPHLQMHFCFCPSCLSNTFGARYLCFWFTWSPKNKSLWFWLPLNLSSIITTRSKFAFAHKKSNSIKLIVKNFYFHVHQRMNHLIDLSSSVSLSIEFIFYFFIIELHYWWKYSKTFRFINNNIIQYYIYSTCWF